MKKIILGTLLATSLLFGARVDLDGGLKVGVGYLLVDNQTDSLVSDTVVNTVNLGLDFGIKLNKNLVFGVGMSVHQPLSNEVDTATDFEVGMLKEAHLKIGFAFNKKFMVYTNGSYGIQDITDSNNKDFVYSGGGVTYGAEIKFEDNHALDVSYTSYNMSSNEDTEIKSQAVVVAYSLKF